MSFKHGESFWLKCISLWNELVRELLVISLWQGGGSRPRAGCECLRWGSVPSEVGVESVCVAGGRSENEQDIFLG
jgi:hypothetical protein